MGSDSLTRGVEHANTGFLDVYREALERESREVPVLVVLADKLVLVRRQRRADYSLASNEIATIKGVAHMPVALFVAVTAMGERHLDGRTHPTLTRLEADVKRIEHELSVTGRGADHPAATAPLLHVLSTTRTLLERLVRGAKADAETLRSFGESVRGALRACLATACGLQLSLLHERVCALVDELEPWERRALQVVVVGDHQARRRSLPMQYFEKRFSEAPGTEARLVYGENIRSVDEALALVGARLLDVAIAETFFGDPSRLYRDVLGDAAQEQLSSLHLDPLP